MMQLKCLFLLKKYFFFTNMFEAKHVYLELYMPKSKRNRLKIKTNFYFENHNNN